MRFILPGSGMNKKLTGTFTDILMADMNNDGLLGLFIPKFNITWSKELLISSELLAHYRAIQYSAHFWKED